MTFAKLLSLTLIATYATGCGGTSELEVKVDSLAKSLQASNARVATLEAKLTALEGVSPGQISDLVSNISGLLSEVSTLKSDTATLRSDMGPVQAYDLQIAANRTAIDAIDFTDNVSRLDALEIKTAAIEGIDFPGNVSRLDALETKTAAMAVATIAGKPAITFDGVNVYIRNGKQRQDKPLDADIIDGTGNLMIGYNHRTMWQISQVVTGSHNLLLGQGAAYSSYGAIIGGFNNYSSAPAASVLGGQESTASGLSSVVVAGVDNITAGWNSAIVAGTSNSTGNTASPMTKGKRSAILGGYKNNESAMNVSKPATP